MSEHPSFDRAKGFVALPVEVLELELTPGAFRLLVELCRMANLDGYCWPSLAQLSDRLGRSRSAISGYVKDLRTEGLIETEEQKTANGYNYRLKYRVTFWQKWRADVATPARSRANPKTEHRVRQSERLKDKNHIHINHCQGKLDSDSVKLVSDWADCFKGAAYPSVAKFPDPILVANTQGFLDQAGLDDQIISADIISELKDLWQNLSLEPTTSELRSHADLIKKQGYKAPQRARIFDAIARQWPAHWRRSPDQKQFEKMVRGAKVASPNAEKDVLRGYLKRWELAQKHLPRPALSDCVRRNDASAVPARAQ